GRVIGSEGAGEEPWECIESGGGIRFDAAGFVSADGEVWFMILSKFVSLHSSLIF
ncbi:MAG: hypothetical protein ACI956_002346, partial [Nonlabens sp.]